MKQLPAQIAHKNPPTKLTGAKRPHNAIGMLAKPEPAAPGVPGPGPSNPVDTDIGMLAKPEPAAPGVPGPGPSNPVDTDIAQTLAAMKNARDPPIETVALECTQHW